MRLPGSALVVRVSKPTTMTSVEAVHVDVDDTGTVDVQPQPKFRETGPKLWELLLVDVFGGALAMSASNAGLSFLLLGEYWNLFRLYVRTYWERRLSTGQLIPDAGRQLGVVYVHMSVGYLYLMIIHGLVAQNVGERWTYYKLLNRNVVVDFQNRHGCHWRSCCVFWKFVAFLAVWPLSVLFVVAYSFYFSQGQGLESLASKLLQCFIFTYAIFTKIKKVRDLEINGLISLNSLLEATGTGLEDSAKWLSKALLIKEEEERQKGKKWLRRLHEKHLGHADYIRFRRRFGVANSCALLWGPVPVSVLMIFIWFCGSNLIDNVTEGVICPDDPRLDAASSLFNAWVVMWNPRTPACSNFTATYINGSDYALAALAALDYNQ